MLNFNNTTYEQMIPIPKYISPITLSCSNAVKHNFAHYLIVYQMMFAYIFSCASVVIDQEKTQYLENNHTKQKFKPQDINLG